MLKSTFTNSKWNSHFAKTVDENEMWTKQFFPRTFPDLDKFYINFREYSRFSVTFLKNDHFSRFSRFSMSPVDNYLQRIVTLNSTRVVPQSIKLVIPSFFLSAFTY